MSQVSFSDFKEEALNDPKVLKEYMELKPSYEFRKKLIELRLQAGLTQAEMAKKLHTQKSNISRLENINTKSSPRLSTIEDYAHAVGYELKIDFIPQTT